ncbi:hypothetical protein LIER_19532 [Lithospermum erythrorhizon]|uniref:Transposase-associated domain-containing protein n=1 Tax=Lithospermum erythrorhizon TaxID=34254 RepID=A0AAV3QNP5_LITER
MDKSWIGLDDRASTIYMSGVQNFLDFSCSGKEEGSKIYYPCSKCHNRLTKKRHEIVIHYLKDGFLKTYKNWRFHGEPFESLQVNSGVDFDHGNDMVDMLREGMGYPVDEALNSNESGDPNDDTNKFFRLMEEVEVELYPGCKFFSKLSFIVFLLQEKVINGWTDKSVDTLLNIFSLVLPEGSRIPTSYYEAKKITKDLGFTSQKIDVCPNNYMLFRGEDSLRKTCKICGESRYKDPIKKISAKHMRYLPLKPRLQKLFMSSKTASLMRWHGEERKDDGVIRHPSDSLGWKDFDKKYSEFASDIRNVESGWHLMGLTHI